MKYFVVKTFSLGDQILRAKSKNDAIAFLENNEIAYFDIDTLKKSADENLGEGNEGFILNR